MQARLPPAPCQYQKALGGSSVYFNRDVILSPRGRREEMKVNLTVLKLESSHFKLPWVKIRNKTNKKKEHR